MSELTAETILQTLSEHHETLRELGAVKLGLFGSFVRGEQRPDSDLDFVVVLAKSYLSGKSTSLEANYN
ncbi:MAG: hypothetical protein OHK0046_11500 [Anaerolineae bacterium]